MPNGCYEQIGAPSQHHSETMYNSINNDNFDNVSSDIDRVSGAVDDDYDTNDYDKDEHVMPYDKDEHVMPYDKDEHEMPHDSDNE